MTGDAEPDQEHLDVLIVGAGLAGVAAGCRLAERFPEKNFAVLEARDAIGGTWDHFRYPGIRSDSDMFTLGYSFRPWKNDETIADGAAIRAYIRDTARAYGVESRIRFRHRVVRAEWSSGECCWMVEVERTDSGERRRLSCDFLLCCTGYYRYDRGFTPEFPGRDRFPGPIIHPHRWPEELDYRDQRVVVIGSGATAVTMVPAMAAEAGHVTMLQRSPSYYISVPRKDPVARLLRPILPRSVVHRIIRWQNARVAQFLFQLSHRRPGLVKALLGFMLKRQLPPGYPTDPNFRPRYQPWDQRPCFVPEGDLFQALEQGKVSIVTDRIETFTEAGIRLASGKELEADLIVTATGLEMLFLGGIELAVDGRPVSYSDTVAYKTMMLAGVPNLAWTFGYTHNAYTLKTELVIDYVCRLLTFMKANGYRAAVPRQPDQADGRRPYADLESGYVRRGIEAWPKHGSVEPWRLPERYTQDRRQLRRCPMEDEGIEFLSAPPAAIGAGHAEAVTAG